MSADKGDKPKVVGSSKGERRGGRTKGTPNKKTQAVIDQLKEIGCDPIAGMAEIALLARNSDDLTLAGQMYKELAQYVAPKRKAIEITGANDGDLFPESILVTHE